MEKKNLHGSEINKISNFLRGLNVMKLRSASKNTRHYVKKPSQAIVAKHMLPSNVGRKPVNVKISRMTGRIPAHLPFNRSGRYTAGHNTIQNWLSMYNTNMEKQARIRNVQNRMEAHQRELGNKIKKRLNKMLNNYS